MMRLTAYASGSIALAGAVLAKAVHERANFFSACIYLSQSNACVITLVNLLVLLVGTTVFGLQRLLYGPLRPVEAEQLYDKAWFAITETCLAMTIFREEIGVWFIVLFISLLVGKVWAWIGEGRVEILDQQPPANPTLFHVRLATSLFLSLVLDTFLLTHSISTVRRQAKPNMMVMFAFEFAVLTTGSISTTVRYLISLREMQILKQKTEERLNELRDRRRAEREGDMQQEGNGQSDSEDDVDEMDIEPPEWEDKSRWILYLELLTDLVRLVLYLVFFVVLCVFYGMPLHIIRDVAIALRSFHKRLTDFVKYRHATRDMNERYSDATSSDMGNDDVCIICRETMRPWNERDNTTDQRSRPKKLPCGHILHFGCLRRWLQWQQNCPTCRQPVLREATQHANAGLNPPLAAAAEANLENAPGPGHQRNEEEGLGRPAPAILAATGQNHNANRQGEGQRNRWRRFQMGPLTLDIGAWPGAEPPVEPNLNPPRGDAAPEMQGNDTLSPLRLGSPTSLQANHASFQSNEPVQAQIDALEQQLALQISILRSSARQLHNAQRSLQTNNDMHAGLVANHLSTAQLYSSDRSSPVLHAGSQELPGGLVIPDGWTIVPLRRVQEDPTVPGDHVS